MAEPSPIAPAVQSVAEIATPNAARYLQQLCKQTAVWMPVKGC